MQGECRCTHGRQPKNNEKTKDEGQRQSKEKGGKLSQTRMVGDGCLSHLAGKKGGGRLCFFFVYLKKCISEMATESCSSAHASYWIKTIQRPGADEHMLLLQIRSLLAYPS